MIASLQGIIDTNELKFKCIQPQIKCDRFEQKLITQLLQAILC